ncbi:MAG: hypothetical protein WDN47_02290 [Candidatus Doudnabacteria bacterium]
MRIRYPIFKCAFLASLALLPLTFSNNLVLVPFALAIITMLVAGRFEKDINQKRVFDNWPP